MMAAFRILWLSLLLCLGSAAAFGQVSSAERAALIDFYHATGGSDWHDNTNWLADEGTECQWHGVQCASAGGKHFVLRLVLEGNNLTGELPDSMAGLDGLTTLILGDNQLHGTIPDTLPPLSMLDLGNNRLDGELPEWFAQLNLARLDLDNNRLSGPIERVFEAMDLDNFPLGRLGLVLHVANNRFSGPLPDIDLYSFNNPTLGRSPEFGLDLCFNDIELPDAEVLERMKRVHRGGSPVACLGREEADFDLTVSGSWFGPERSGEGITQMVLENGQLLSYWFTYRPDHPRGQMWLFDVSDSGQSWNESRPLWGSSGGRFGQGLMGSEVFPSAVWMRQNRIDQDTVHFFYDYLGPSICITGLCSFNIKTGRHDLIRLTGLAGSTCDNQRATQHLSGAWYNPERAGEGFMVEVNEDGLGVLYWFTYLPDESGRQAWMLGTGDIERSIIGTPPPDFPEYVLEIDNMVRPTGTVFGPDFQSEDVVWEEWGSVTIEFFRQGTGHVFWNSADEAFGSGDYPIEPLARPMLAECEGDPEGSAAQPR